MLSIANQSSSKLEVDMIRHYSSSLYFFLAILLVSSITLKAQDTNLNCNESLPPRLIPGLWGEVLENPPNSIRNAPTENADVIGSIPIGRAFRVLSEPVCDAVSGMNWWQVNYDGVSGWTAEGQGDTYWLKPHFSNGDTITPQNAHALRQIASFGKGSINDTVLAPNGRWLVLAANGLGIWMYDLNQPKQEPLLFEGRLVSIPLFSADSRFIAAKVCNDWVDAGGGHIGCTEVQVIVWNVIGGRQELAIPDAGGDGVIGTMVFSPTDPLLFISALEGIQVWDIAAKQQRYLIPDSPLIWPNERTLFLSGNGQYLITRMVNENLIQIWNSASGLLERTIQNEQLEFMPLAIELNYDASVMIVPTARSDRETVVMDIETGEILATLAWDIRSAGKHYFLPDGSNLAIKYPDDRAIIWDFRNQQIIQELGYYDSYAFSTDNQHYAGVMTRNRVDIINRESGAIETQITGLYRLENFGITNNGLFALSREGSDTQIVWNIATAQPELQLEAHNFLMSSQGQIVAWDYHPEIVNWYAFVNSPVQEIPIPENTDFLDAAISGDDLLVILGEGDTQNRILSLWNALENQMIGRMAYPGYGLRPEPFAQEDSLVHSVDGRLIVFTDRDREQLYIWNMETGQQINNVASGFYPLFTAFSPDSKTVVIITCLDMEFNYSCQRHTETESFYEYHIFFWNLDQNTLVQGTNIQSTYISEIAFSPDSRLLAIAGCSETFTGSEFCNQGKFEIWDVAQRSPVVIQNIYNNIVSHVQFSPDGTVLAVNAYHGIGGLWAISGD